MGFLGGMLHNRDTCRQFCFPPPERTAGIVQFVDQPGNRRCMGQSGLLRRPLLLIRCRVMWPIDNERAGRRSIK